METEINPRYVMKWLILELIKRGSEKEHPRIVIELMALSSFCALMGWEDLNAQIMEFTITLDSKTFVEGVEFGTNFDRFED